METPAMKEEEETMESRIRQAMKSRLQHFKDQSDSLTFEGVRRVLEKDMVLDTYTLDSHKKFVKQLLEKFLSGAEEDDEPKGGAQIKLEEESVKEVKAEDSSATDLSSAKTETLDKETGKTPNEDMIKEAIWNKATYFRSKSEELTLAGVRRLLEQDLELEKFSLDPFKKLISKQLDEVLNSENDKDAESSPSPSHIENENIQAEVKRKKKTAVKEKVKKSEETKKRKKPAQETEQPRKKKVKQPEKSSVEKNNVQDQSSDESSGGKSVKEVAAPVYGKKVERLKSIIKACGMTVAPTVYKKAKQAPEDKREAVLIKELQEILSKEGLSTNPSEKEIKDVKRRKERAKELEGIDMSNIVQGSRRRSTTFPPPPPKPKEPIESDSDESEDEDGSDDADGSDDQEEDVQATQSGDDQDEDVPATQSGDDEDDDVPASKSGDDQDDDVAATKSGDDQDEDVQATKSGEEVHAETFDSD
ncbi:transcription initiation factor TFIID subunit 11 isoform X2 [Helianthus annuus]|uniref:transcription initiation factor TFIID subunit 11 isoform X2 n=1 Tax=Helianthus annuus TaxID=4232 RepID=UPI000B902344|nr:transcription initiation factor TFIID subunit 11 isoform X2 [Helianthus annuus]